MSLWKHKSVKDLRGNMIVCACCLKEIGATNTVGPFPLPPRTLLNDCGRLYQDSNGYDSFYLCETCEADECDCLNQLIKDVPVIRVVYIMIGLPGASKSTRAQQIFDDAIAQGLTATKHSTDDFFMVGDSYVFDYHSLGEYHAKNQISFLRSLINGTNVIVVDNTNLYKAHRQAYSLPAKQAGYRVRYEVVGGFTAEDCAIYAARNIHGVPADKIVKMARGYEPLTAEETDPN